MRVHWILFGSRETGSSRIHGHQIHEELIREGYDSRLLVAPPRDVQMYDLPWDEPEIVARSELIQAGDVVVFETVRGERAQRMAKVLRTRGVEVCLLECDLYPSSEIAEAATSIICTSRFLSEEMQKRHPLIPVRTISDPVEELLKDVELPLRVRNQTEDLRVVWIGQASHWETLETVREILAEEEFWDLKLMTVSNHPQANLMWSRETAIGVMRSADIMVVPVGDTPRALAKSSNRVVQGMALGCAVIAGDLPSYRDVIEEGKTGYLCRNRDEWREAFRRVREVGHRRGMVYKGFKVAAGRFSIQQSTKEYLEAWRLNKSEDRTEGEWPKGMRAEQSAEYACWYLAQGRSFEGIGWMLWGLVQERNCEGARRAWDVLAARVARKLRQWKLWKKTHDSGLSE